jgi:hypothetical protein
MSPSLSASASGIAGRVKYWNGSAWVIKPLKVYLNGSWVEKPPKFRSGGSWNN